MPPELLQAYIDLGARHFVGMHWAPSTSDEPIDRRSRPAAGAGRTRGLDPDRIHLLSHGGVSAADPRSRAAGRHGRWAPQSRRTASDPNLGRCHRQLGVDDPKPSDPRW